MVVFRRHFTRTDPAPWRVFRIRSCAVRSWHQEQPTIEEAQADFSMFGIQMRGFHDFGVKKQDPRGGIKMMGR
ncbi:MAG: hypothetical protein L6R48_25580 [Planctomycetes bacterium]|nr:hypothetical protein [Planctomycetota bacterium]